MPRRRDPLKTRAIPVLLRDAQPTWREIDGEPNERKQQERRHARDAATDTLMRMHRDAEERDALARLDPRIRNFVADLKTRNRMLHRKRLPKPKGGRPFGDRERRLRLAIEIREKIEALGIKRGSVEAALLEVADRLGVSYDYLREIHYDRDPEWRRAVKAELGRRKYEAAVQFSSALWFWEAQIQEMIFISEFEQGPAIFGQGVLSAPSSSPQLSVCAIK